SLQVLPGGRGLHRRRAAHLRAERAAAERGGARGPDPRQREAPERDPLRRPRLRGDRIRAEVRVHQFHPTLAPGDAMSNHVFARLGLRQLSRIAPAFELGIGVSEFNRRALAEAGYEETARVPILLDWEHFAVPPNDAVLARWKGMRTALLFVGRISPNKRQDD